MNGRAHTKSMENEGMNTFGVIRMRAHAACVEVCMCAPVYVCEDVRVCVRKQP